MKKTMKRTTCILAALAMVLMVKAEEIEINNIEGLQAIAADAYYNNNTYSGTVIKLTADLDLANVSWTPIGTPEAPFNGTFDGGGHTLSNLNVLIDGAMTGNVAGIEAGKPYIVKWDRQMAGNLPNPVFMDVTVSNTLSSITTDEVMFEGCFSPIAIDGESRKMLYLGSNNRVYYPSSTMDINSFRAYFLLRGDLVCGDPNSSVGINAFALNFGDDNETGIALTSHPTSLPLMLGTRLTAENSAASPPSKASISIAVKKS